MTHKLLDNHQPRHLKSSYGTLPTEMQYKNTTPCLLHPFSKAYLPFLVGTIVGHVGDGNFHAILLIDPESESELTEGKRLANIMAE